MLWILDLRWDDDHRSGWDILRQHRAIAAVDRPACPSHRKVTLPQIHRPLQDGIMMNDLLDRQLGQDASEDEHGTQEDPLDALFDLSPQQTSSPRHPMMGSCRL